MDTTQILTTSPDREAAATWWSAIFHSSEEAQFVCRTDGAVDELNQRAARLFNLDPATAAGTFSIFKIFSPPADEKIRQVLEHEKRHRDTIHSVTTLRNGMRQAPMDIELIPIGEEHTLVILREASHRLRLESHVQRLVTAIDATPDVFFITDADLRITFVNPAFQSLTGYHIEEVLGRSDEFLRAPAERYKVEAYLNCITQGREWFGELVNVKRNGERYFTETTISPICDIAGRFMGYVACERDVTSRKQLQDALRTERDFVQSILQSLDGAIYSLDRDFRLTHFNDGWRNMPAEHGGIKLIGAPEIGRALLDYVPDTTRRAELRYVFQDVITSGKTQDNRFQSADGRHWLMKISPWINSDRVSGLICNVADQTHYHELQNQLFQSQKMEIIGTLAAGVAHDFNNLLQAIRGHAGLILMQTTTEKPIRLGLERIDMAAARAADITKQLLSFSRASEDRNNVLDLNSIIKEASHLAKRTLRSNVSLELRPTPRPIGVKMNSTRASQALLNLCVNAQDAMPNGGCLTITNTIVELPIDIATHRNLEAGSIYARCSVADTGSGIAADLLPRIFQPFFTTKEKGKGTGLGLPIVQRVAEEAGGFVEVESTVGKGTTFHLYLPLAGEQLTPVAAPSQAPLTRGTGRVLIVDDVDLLRDFTKSFLQAAGFTVLVASSGAEALKILEREIEPIKLLFTDYSMPGMNGVELIEAIAPRWPKMKFVLASGYLDAATRIRIEQCQASILSKPYDMRDAADIVMQKLKES